MRNLTLRLPDDLHEALSTSSEDRGKSLNGLICELLARGMTEHGLRRSLVEAVRQEMRAEREAKAAIEKDNEPFILASGGSFGMTGPMTRGEFKTFLTAAAEQVTAASRGAKLQAAASDAAFNPHGVEV